LDTRPIKTPGWPCTDGLFLDLWSDRTERSAEVSAGLHALIAVESVDVIRERLDFLG
jgi:hypothetical protein